MKITQILVLFFSVIGTLTMQSQSIVVKKELSKLYDNPQNKELIRQLTDDYIVENRIIEDLKLKDTLFQSEFVANGNFYQAQRIENKTVIYYQTHNFKSRNLSGLNQLQSKSNFNGLKGENMWIGIIDGDLPFDRHIEFSTPLNSSSRLFNRDEWKKIENEEEDNHKAIENKRSHATHVLGTILAQGKRDIAKGMAPEAKAIGYSWGNDMEKLAQLALEGVLVTNQSYGLALLGVDKKVLLPSYYLGAYVKESALLDQLSYNFPYLQPVVSAGNDRANYKVINPSKFGMDLLVGHSTSKNAVVVGAIGLADSSSTSFWKETDFSSYGPTSDLRIKPDIVAIGQNVVSSAYRYLYNGEIEKVNLYTSSSGTSMASPSVAGIFLIWQQYCLLHNSLPLKSASIKGVMVNTAKNISNGPNAKTGWGIIDAYNGAKLLEGVQNKQALLLEGNLLHKQIKKYQVELIEDAEQLLFTLVWTDVEGRLSKEINENKDKYKALVNDLDIRVYKDGKEYYPWKLVNDSYYSEAVKGDNSVDNVERIDIDFPIKGIYDIVISHKHTLQNYQQDFSLVVNTKTYSGIAIVENEQSDYLNTEMYIWPNPTSDIINIEIPDDVIFENKNLEIYDGSGKYVANIKLGSNNRQVVDISFLPKGIYLLQIKGTKSKLRAKFIKK